MHPVHAEMLSAALAPSSPIAFTTRDAGLSTIPKKAHAGIGMEQLGFLLDEYYRRCPSFRGRETVHWLFDEVQLAPGAVSWCSTEMPASRPRGPGWKRSRLTNRC